MAARRQRPAGLRPSKPARGPAPAEPAVPPGPHVQESLGGAAPVVTHEDMLQNAARRGPLGVLRDLAARDRRPRDRQGDAGRQGGDHRIRAHLARRQAPPGHHDPPPVLVPACSTASSPRKSRSGTAPARCCTRSPASRSRTRCRSTASPIGTAQHPVAAERCARR